MNWDMIGAVGEWAGAIAVVATLFYLTRQIRVNAKQLERQIDSNLDNLVFQAYDPVYEGRNSEIMFNGLYEPEKLTAFDRYTFDLLMYRQAHVIFTVGERYRLGEMTKDQFQNYASHYSAVLIGTPGGSEWFKEHGDLAKATLREMGIGD